MTQFNTVKWMNAGSY